MTIHHDKLAYGKLAPQSEEMKEEEILKMLEQLNGEKEREEEDEEERDDLTRKA